MVHPGWITNPGRGAVIAPMKIGQSVYIAIFTKKGKQFNTTGKVLYGPVATNTISLRRVSDGTGAVNVDESKAKSRSFFVAVAAVPARI